ncbi:amidohydrolase family protein, partial [bacterium]|nr:amidohydrolase family protein [bacterium]
AADKAAALGSRSWNPAVRPQLKAATLFKADSAAAGSFRKAGFAAALTFPPEGIFRGAGALVLLDGREADESILRPEAAQAAAFSKGSLNQGYGPETYPASEMGAIALIRQSLLDARWYGAARAAYDRHPAGQSAPETDLALAALGPYAEGKSPFLFACGDELDILRAAKICREFGLKGWALGAGTEYRRASEVAASGLGLILPLDFPEVPDLSQRERELDVSLRELKRWDAAPENPARLLKAGARFALSAHGLEKPEQFLDKLRLAVRRGLDRDSALAALTTVPAARLGMDKTLGRLDKGYLASFILVEGDLFDKGRVLETWVAGERFEILAQPPVDPRGKWQVSLRDGVTAQVEIGGQAPKFSATAEVQGRKLKASTVALEERRLSLAFPTDSLGRPGVARLWAILAADTLRGEGVEADGSTFAWSALRTAPAEPKPDSAKDKPVSPALFGTVYPDGAFGWSTPPEQPADLLVKNAVIWTCGPAGKLEGADLLVHAGKIVKVGKGLTAPAGATVVDAAGRHVTPGIIDAHSHLAIAGGVNEGTHALVSEVRIEDVIDPDDIDIYRQLAGGTTMALLIHGSANPIGGQTSLVKLRWGELPERMIFDAQQPAIKFALGENVKQNYLPDQYARRYPRSRMGVEQFMLDSFQAARDYRSRWKIYEEQRKKQPDLVPPRRDLRQEALLEVLDGKRQVQCHSYRQDEILAMMRVAEREGFRIGMFIHVLEGYKVADELARHGAYPTTFSDWWAYKAEVVDAIPYNGALMRAQGCTVSFNSDNDELGRRLNYEAAKAVKYGGVPPEEALKFVTLNPAIQLGVAARVGSLEPGKDADFVIWSGDPLSVYSHCEQTWLDGRRFFDRTEDSRMRLTVESQRAALIQKILRSGGEK